MPEEDALLEEIISKINERFDGIFSEGDRVIVETLYNRAKENKKLNRQAQKNDEEVYTKSIFPEVFKQVAQDCYIEQVKAFSKLFEDKRFYDTVMATLAQEESRKTSERVKWGQKRQMEQGVVFGRSMLGYDVKAGKMYINEDGAKIVRLIFRKFVDEGKGTHVIARELREEGIEPMRVKEWQNTVILRVIRNEKYCGDLVQKKTFTPDFLSHEGKPHFRCKIAFTGGQGKAQQPLSVLR